MRKILAVSLLSLFVVGCGKTVVDYDGYVNQYVGTGYHGHTFIGASAPFGAIQVGPQNIVKGWDWCSGYHYSDSVVIGFSHTHMNGTGISDGGDLLIMPYTGEVKTDKGSQDNPDSGYASRYSHDSEKASLGYYSLLLEDYGILAELTASERSAMHRYNFSEDADTARIIIDLKEGSGWDKPTACYMEQEDDKTIVGYRYSDGWGKGQQFYFVVKFENSIPAVQFYNDSLKVSGSSIESAAAKAIISFVENPGSVSFKVGVSPVSVDNAKTNLKEEIGKNSFEEIVALTKNKWNKELGKIEIETQTDSLKSIFYTAMYHTMVSPNLYNDVNGDYRGTDKKVYRGADFQNYTMLSLWDTYRAANPLYTITHPERVNDFINTMLNIYKQQGKLPIWHLRGDETNTMVGYSAVPIVVDAYMKGFDGFDSELAFEAVKASAMYDERGMDYIKRIEYIPYDKDWESVAKAMEYCISDWSIAQMAQKMGKIDDAELFARRSKYYKHYYDTETGYFRGKDEKGEWNPTFAPNKAERPWIADYTEGNAAQYLWLVPHDVEGLIELLGGEQEFNRRLDKFFVDTIDSGGVISDITGLIGLYAHGNEPGHQTIYMYAYSGEQWKSAEKSRFIVDNMYSNRPEGIIGNEDCGQMSAWYIFSTMGFYPLNASNGAYVLGSPRFDKVVMNLENNKKFIVRAVDNSTENIYIQRVELNGEDYPKSFITHKDIVTGGELVFYMGNTPNKEFGTLPENRPKSVQY